MRTACLITAALVCGVSSAIGQASADWTARETAMWQAVKDKKIEPFAAGLDSTFVGVYTDGLHTREIEVAQVRQVNLKTFRLSDLTVRRLDRKVVLLTYKADVAGESGSTDISGSYWIASIWQMRGAQWRGVMHTEVKAP
jgi:hypothetical protein